MRVSMLYKSLALPSVVLALTLLVPAQKIPAAEDAALETLNKYVAELKKKPDAQELRAKIISFALSMKSRPPLPEDAERALSRGNIFLKMASEKEGKEAKEAYEKAIPELQEVINNAPWLADGYLNLSIAQEKAGYYADAIQNLNFYLLIDPRAKNTKDIKKRIYELEVYAENAHQTVPVPVKLPSSSGKKQDAAPLAPEKRVDPDIFVGSWYSTDKNRQGEEIAVHAFTLTKNTKGDLIATPPRRTTGTIGSITKFEIYGRNVKIQMSWKSSSIPGYWKTENFDLVLSNDESKLSGRYTMDSSGSRDFSGEMVYTRQ